MPNGMHASARSQLRLSLYFLDKKTINRQSYPCAKLKKVKALADNELSNVNGLNMENHPLVQLKTGLH
jgi:hypothetical protein